ncbi:MAG: LacI family transcriptional regulator [bacterium]|nr:LacI family transcriptional regulator [bacterium]
MAGVSAKTVSRVVNREQGVGEATRARIERIIEEVGYHPHMGARTMRSRPRDSIGVTLAAPPSDVPLSQALMLRMFTELYRIFGSKGEYVCLDLNPYERSPQGDYARGLWEQRYWGCIICGPLPVDDQTVLRVHRSGAPYLVLGRALDLDECSCGTVDFEEGAYLSAKFLLERGHTAIAMLKGLDGYQPNIERRRGYIRAMEEAGVEPRPELIRPVLFNSRDLVSATHRVLREPDVTALIDASGAEDAASIRDGARRAGRTLGGNCEVVSWTYTYNAAVLNEASAHLWLPVIEAAIEGMEALAEWFRGTRDEPVHVVYRPTLHETVSREEIPKPRPFFEVRT